MDHLKPTWPTVEFGYWHMISQQVVPVHPACLWFLPAFADRTKCIVWIMAQVEPVALLNQPGRKIASGPGAVDNGILKPFDKIEGNPIVIVEIGCEQDIRFTGPGASDIFNELLWRYRVSVNREEITRSTQLRYAFLQPPEIACQSRRSMRSLGVSGT